MLSYKPRWAKELIRKVDRMAATVESLETQLTELTTDLQALAAAATAEFAKLEQEVSEGKPVNLDGVQTAIDNIDKAVKGAVVPTD